MANGPQYSGAIPVIAQAYKNDPRTELMQQALAAGTSTAPVAGGGWAVPAGLARVVQALAGGLMERDQNKKYGMAEKGYSKDLINATNGLDASTYTPPPQYAPFKAAQVQSGPAAQALTTPDPAQLAAQGLSGAPPAPLSSAPPSAGLAAMQPPQQAPVGPGMLPPNPSGGGAPNSRPAVANLAAMMTPITARSESGNRERLPNGQLVTSPAGAQGAMQVMPTTNLDPGFGVKPAQDGSDAERTRVGQDYLAAMTNRYGDPAKAWAAYNAGPGAVDRRIKRYGDNWLAHMPSETQAYVAKNLAQLQNNAPAPSPANVPTLQPEAVPAAPQAPTIAPEAPQVAAPNGSARLAMARRLIESGNPYLMTMAQSYLDSGLTERSQNENEARREQAGLNAAGYQSALGDFTGARQDARQAGYQDNRDALNRNFQRENANNQNTFTAGQNDQNRAFQHNERIGTEQFTAGQNELTRAAAEKLQSLKNQGVKVPVSVQNDFRKSVYTTQMISNMTDMLKAHPDQVGVLFMSPEQITSRTNPDGVKMRALINNMGSQIMHDRSGAAVTVEEFARQRGWYPSVGDNAQTIIAKLSALSEGMQQEQNIILQMYQGAPQFQAFANNPAAAPFAVGQQGGGAPNDGFGQMVTH